MFKVNSLVILIKEERNTYVFVFCFNKLNPVNKSKRFRGINLDSRVQDINKSRQESSEELATGLQETKGSVSHI